MIVALCGTGAGIALLSVTPPEPILRKLVVASSSRLLAPHASKLLGSYFEFALTAKMARTVAEHGDADDVARIDYALRRAQLRVLNANEMPHEPHSWPVLVAGFGWCDQVNSVAAQVLAHSFRSSQLYALYDPKAKWSPHTVGRVWSDQRREWLYFDAFYSHPVVYRKPGPGRFEILNKSRNLYPDRDDAVPHTYYALDGWVMSDYPATYPTFLARKFLAAFHDPNEAAKPAPLQVPPAPLAAPVPVQPAVASDGTAAPVAAPPSGPPRDAAVFARVARLYVDARAEDLLGDRRKARAKYLSVAETPDASLDDGARLLADAARVFARH